MKWRNSKERELIATGGSREQTLPTKNNPNPDLSDPQLPSPGSINKPGDGSNKEPLHFGFSAVTAAALASAAVTSVADEQRNNALLNWSLSQQVHRPTAEKLFQTDPSAKDNDSIEVDIEQDEHTDEVPNEEEEEEDQNEDDEEISVT